MARGRRLPDADHGARRLGHHASVNATLQAGIAAHYGGNYAFALALVAGIVAVIIVVLTAVGHEAKGVAFGDAGMRAEPATSLSQ
jgi:SHS family lactate transporter-like MFS transporter